jgi:hypothetical protein
VDVGERRKRNADNDKRGCHDDQDGARDVKHVPERCCQSISRRTCAPGVGHTLALILRERRRGIRVVAAVQDLTDAGGLQRRAHPCGARLARPPRPGASNNSYNPTSQMSDRHQQSVKTDRGGSDHIPEV